MKLLQTLAILAISIFLNHPTTFAKELYSSNVSCQTYNGKTADFNSTGIADKKKEVTENALKAIFNTLFLNGVSGINNGEPLFQHENSYYWNEFFASKYQFFIHDYTEIGKPKKTPSGDYRGEIKATVNIDALINDLIRNKIMEKPLEMVSMKETQKKLPLPTIMVVPYKKDMHLSYAKILQNDFDLRIAVSAVDNGFKQRHVNTISVEMRTDIAQRSMNWEANNADSNDKQLLLNSGSDVYVIVDLKKDINSQGSRISLIMTARETATGRTLASRSSWTNRFKTSKIDQLCSLAVKDVLDSFLNDISIEFAKKSSIGNTIALRVGISSMSGYTLNDRVGDNNVSISSLIRNWVRKNAENNRYHIQGAVAESLIFDTIQIPAKDIDGLPLDASIFADNLVFYLDEQGINSSVRLDGNTIYLTIE